MIKKILITVLALLLGLFMGSMVNGFLVGLGAQLVTLPVGLRTDTLDHLREAMPHFEFKHFVFPFVAHAFGTLVGSAIAAGISKSYSFLSAFIVGLFFFIGGAYMVFSLPSPLLFDVIDLVFAYFPMAYLGYLLAQSFHRRKLKSY